MGYVINATGSGTFDVTMQNAQTKLDRNSVHVGLEVFILILIWVLSVIGNVFVCVVINRSRRIQSTTNYFVISLACADLILAFLSMPFALAGVAANQWILGNSVCKFVRFVQYLVPCVNMYILVCIAIDRFYTIIYPLSFKVTKGTAKRMIMFCWFSAVAISGVCFFFFETVTVTVVTSREEVCPVSMPRDWSGILFTMFVFAFEVVLPTVLLSGCYTRVFNYIWQIQLGSRLFHRTMNPVPRTKVKVVKMLMVVTLTSVVSYVPFYVTQVLYSLSRLPPPWLPSVVMLTVCSAGVSKPLVYLCYNSNFRRGCKEVLCMSAMRCYRSNTYAITTASAIGKKNHIGIMEMVTSDSMSTTPSKIFNRSLLLEQSVWPIASPTASTYM